MIDIPKLFRRKAEVRASYADQVVAQIMSAASGASDGSALAALETASRLWGAGLASASVKPDNVALRSVSPVVLDAVSAGACAVRCESLHVIEPFAMGELMLTPASSWDVHGERRPEQLEIHRNLERAGHNQNDYAPRR